MQGGVDIFTVTGLESELAHHVRLLLKLQQSNGSIPSIIEPGREIEKDKLDLPRQAMATMALLYSDALMPKLHLKNPADKALEFIEKHIGEVTDRDRVYVFLYLALACVYQKKDPAMHVQKLLAVATPEILSNHLVLNLYLRLSFLLPKRLPNTAYFVELVRANISMLPRTTTFFYYSDALVWGDYADADIVSRERWYLMKHYRGGWFLGSDMKQKVTASVAGKMFEVFSYNAADDVVASTLYENVMKQKAKGDYALATMGAYKDHIVSTPGSLRIDDVHSHVIIGLCYRLQRLRSL